jgi:hypothetical protein
MVAGFWSIFNKLFNWDFPPEFSKISWKFFEPKNGHHPQSDHGRKGQKISPIQ